MSIEWTMETVQSNLWAACVSAIAVQHGKPLPKDGLLTIGGDEGWKVQFNPTEEKLGNVEAYDVHVSWNGWLAGIVSVEDGLLAKGARASQDTFTRWLLDWLTLPF